MCVHLNCAERQHISVIHPTVLLYIRLFCGVFLLLISMSDKKEVHIYIPQYIQSDLHLQHKTKYKCSMKLGLHTDSTLAFHNFSEI